MFPTLSFFFKPFSFNGLVARVIESETNKAAIRTVAMAWGYSAVDDVAHFKGMTHK